MKIQKIRTRKRFLIPVLILLILVVFSFFISYGLLQKNSKKNSSQTELISSAKMTNNKASSDINLPEKSQFKTSEEIPTSDKLSISIESVVQSSGLVRTKINTSSSGVCVLNFVPGDGGKPLTKQTSTFNNSCMVDIPEREFSFIGQWRLIVTFYSEKYRAEATKYVSIY